MTLQKAVILLEKEYEKAKNMEYVRHPLAFALYSVWKKAEREGS